MTIIDVLLAVLLLSASALCIYFIISLKKFSASVEDIKRDIHNFVEESVPVIQNLNQISEHAVNVSSTAEKQVLDINNKIEEVKYKLYDFKQKFSKASTDNQITTLITNLRAIIKGISAFVKDIRK